MELLSHWTLQNWARVEVPVERARGSPAAFIRTGAPGGLFSDPCTPSHSTPTPPAFIVPFYFLSREACCLAQSKPSEQKSGFVQTQGGSACIFALPFLPKHGTPTLSTPS